METGEYGGVGSTPKRAVLADINNQTNNGSSPISPMANLKLLIKVATSPSTQQQSEDKRRRLDIREEENSRTEPQQLPQTRKPKYTRQLRSLGFICKKFLHYYSLDMPPGASKVLSLGNLARVLEIEKRRVYDIINVVASLNMAVKVCKDRYIWYGNQYLTSLLLKLKTYALENRFDQLVESTFRGPMEAVAARVADCYSNMNETVFVPTISQNLNNNTTANSAEHSVIEDNRICILCQKFVMLFLVARENTALNLNLVSKVILTRDTEDKTGMRRLYDIANVLESLGIIRRRILPTARKPSFVYCGPDLSNVTAPPSIPIDPSQQDLSDVIPLDSIENNTESDKSECRLSDMLEVVSTELEKLREGNGEGGGSAAKKRLFPSVGEPPRPRQEKPDGESFIRVPDTSFRVLCDTITDRPDENVSSSTDRDPKVFSHLKLSSQSKPVAATTTLLKLHNIARPIRIVRQLKLTPSADIQNGGIYKAVKNGNVVHLVKL